MILVVFKIVLTQWWNGVEMIMIEMVILEEIDQYRDWLKKWSIKLIKANYQNYLI